MVNSPGAYRDMADPNDNVMCARGGRGGQDTGNYGVALHLHNIVDSVVIRKDMQGFLEAIIVKRPRRQAGVIPPIGASKDTFAASSFEISPCQSGRMDV